MSAEVIENSIPSKTSESSYLNWTPDSLIYIFLLKWSDEEIPPHKYILASESPGFEIAFYDSMAGNEGVEMNSEYENGIIHTDAFVP